MLAALVTRRLGSALWSMKFMGDAMVTDIEAILEFSVG
jgi:hypothetical protein